MPNVPVLPLAKATCVAAGNVAKLLGDPEDLGLGIILHFVGMPEGEGDRRGRHTRLLCNVIHRNSCHKTSLSALMHGTHTRSQNHSFSGLLAGIRGAEEKKPGVERISMPLRETWESDGNQGWKDGVPGSQAPRESRKEEGNTGNKKALPGTRMGSAGRTGRRNKRFGDKKWGSRSVSSTGTPNV